MRQRTTTLIATINYKGILLVALLSVLLSFGGVLEPAFGLDKNKELRQCHMETWTNRDGLPAREIQAIAQTPEGYLWVATRAGLLRFNGARFQLYDAHNTPGLKREMIRSLRVTRKGDLWVGTDGGGFGIFKEGRFTPNADQDTAAWSEQRAIYEARDGAIWVGGNGATTLLKIQNGKATPYFQFKADIGAFAEDRAGNLWITGTEPRIACYHPDGTMVSYHNRTDIAGVRFTSVVATRDGDVWFGTDNSGVVRLHKNKFITYTAEQGLRSEQINTLYEDRGGNLWVGTKNGIHRWNGSRFFSFSREQGLPDADVRCIFEDFEGNLWLGAGKNLTRFNNTKFSPYEFGTEGEATVNEIANATDGGVWIATNEGLYHTLAGKRTCYSTKEGLVNPRVISVCVALDGVVYAMCDGGQVCKQTGNRFMPVVGLTGSWHIGADKEGIVVATSPGKLWRYQNGKLHPLTMPVESCYFFAFYRDFQGVLWTACERGIGRILGDKLEIFSEGLPFGTHVLGIVAEPQGGLWVTTDRGLARFQNGVCKMYTTKQGLPDDNLYQILEDDMGKLWIGCNRGVFVLDTEDIEAFDQGKMSRLAYTLYDASQGVRHVPILFGAVKTLRGELWFHGEKGIIVVDPAHLKVNGTVPETRMEEIVVNRQPVPLSANMNLEAGKNEFEFYYTGLSMTAPEKMRFRYKLEGFDEEWIDAGDRRSAFYTNLPPRDFRFLVMASNEDGVWSLKPTAISLHLAPFFYQAWWFRIASSLLLLGAGVIALRWRFWRLKCHNHLLEVKIAERTTELRSSNLELREIQDALENMNAELEASNDELEATNSELATANEKLAALATTDGLTGLANHRTFQERIRHELALTERIGCSLTLLLMDVDNFKQYNDTFGHPAGDVVLRTLGMILKAHVREMDIVARYGGEEFVVIMPHTDALGGSEAAERIRAVVEKYPFPKRAITLSIGAVVVSNPIPIAEEVIHEADQALYRAKRNGRNCVSFAHEQHQKQVA